MFYTPMFFAGIFVIFIGCGMAVSAMLLNMQEAERKITYAEFQRDFARWWRSENGVLNYSNSATKISDDDPGPPVARRY